MKRLLLPGIALAVLAAGFLLLKPAKEEPVITHEKVIPVVTEQPDAPAPTPQEIKEEIISQVQAQPPVKVAFEPPQEPAAVGQTARVKLKVEPQPEAWPQGLSSQVKLELLLRLPVGIDLRSAGWASAQLPPDEAADETGPWKLYEKKGQLNLPGGSLPAQLAEESLELAVTEPGTNWVITTRARIADGPKSWAAFAVIFASVVDNKVEFHVKPKMADPMLKAIATQARG